MLEHEQRRLDLGVVARVVLREERDRAPVQCLEPGGRVGHPLPGQHRDEAGEEDDPDPTRQRRPVRRVVVCEARARDDVRLARLQRGEQLAQLARIVLAVAVEAHRHVVTALEREAKAGLHRGADAQVVRQLHDRRACGSGHCCRAVCRSVVDDDDVEPGVRRGISRTTAPIAPSSSYAGTTAIIRPKVMRPPGGRGRADRAVGVPDARRCARRARARARGRPLPPPGPGLRAARCRPRPRARRPRPRAARARLEPALDARVRVGDDRCSRGRELERAAGRRAGHGRVRAARDVEIDPRRGDGSSEDVERDIAEARAADVALEVAPAEGEVELRRTPTGLADHRGHPLASELVAVAVEEDVDLLLHGCGAKNSGSAAQNTASARRAPSSSRRAGRPPSSRRRGRIRTGPPRGSS